ncbi:transcription factor TGA5 [Artemisia annua]|uniref:Transcription factor TGA5 n=1 Tax=Artemisia annua TaxID=35608 RepID=A0A2U1NAG9_ARTAN|nr:transcription factor TGA5 [Artemisia annua]
MNSLETTFTTFYEGWFNRHHDLQRQLTTDNGRQLRKLVEQASQHYHEYYQEKLTLIEEDVFLACSPPWFTSFEQALFWVTDFPPSLLFRFIKDLNMTNEQSSKVESMKVDTAKKETVIGDAMAMVQESLAVAPLYGLVNRVERLVDGEVSRLDDAMEDVKEAMREVIAEADGLRISVVKGVLEVLDVVQRVKFYAAVGQFRIRVRQVGLQMMATQGAV